MVYVVYLFLNVSASSDAVALEKRKSFSAEVKFDVIKLTLRKGKNTSLVTFTLILFSLGFVLVLVLIAVPLFKSIPVQQVLFSYIFCVYDMICGYCPNT